MPKPPKLPGKEITARIKQAIARHDRNPFQDVLADALTVSPSRTVWRRFAKKDPGKWAEAVTKLAKTAGFSDRSESVNITMDAKDMARELIARHGEDQARLLLKAADLPQSLVDGLSDKPIERTIEGEIVEESETQTS